MEYFEVRSHCFTGGIGIVTADEAAKIMGVSPRTARNYLCGSHRPDPARLELLQARVGCKIIDQDAPIWWDNGEIRTNSGLGFSVKELDQYRWQRDIDLQTIAALSARVKELESKLTASATEPASNVIPFPAHLTRS